MIAIGMQPYLFGITPGLFFATFWTFFLFNQEQDESDNKN